MSMAFMNQIIVLDEDVQGGSVVLFSHLKIMIHFKMTQMNHLPFPNSQKKEKYIFLDAKYMVLMSATRTNLITDSVL